MSVHRDCGEEIRWAKREDDPERFVPPLEFAGHAYIIDENGIARSVTTFSSHRCNPDKVREWADYLRKLALAKDESPVESDNVVLWEAKKQRDSEQAWKVAITTECSTCEARIGAKCHNISARFRKTGEILELKNPHPARLDQAYQLGHGIFPR